MSNSIFPLTSNIWANKYRPTDLKNYIGDPDLKEKIQNLIDKKELKHLLFAGDPGIGKSTLGNIIVCNFDCDVLYINGSDDRGIDIVREQITQFAITSSFKPYKIVFIDEFSEFTPQGQDALRVVMEKFSSTTFILTCNNVDNIISAIRSRCQEYNVSPPNKEKVIVRIKQILESEKVEYDENELISIVEHIFPDVRKIINYLDQYTVNNELKLSKEFYKIIIYKKKIIEILNSITSNNFNNKITEIRQLLADSRVRKYDDLFRFLYQNIDQYKKNDDNIIPIIYSLGKGQLSDSQLVDKEINIVCTLIEIAEIIKN